MRNFLLFFFYYIVNVYCNLSKYRIHHQRNLQINCSPSETQISLQILSYETGNNIMKIKFDSISNEEEKIVKVNLINTYDETFEKNCNLSKQSTEILCTITYEDGIPPGIYQKITINTIAGCNEDNYSLNMLVYLSQTTKNDTQMVVKSASYENDICRGLESFDIVVENVSLATKIKGFLSSGESYQNYITFTCEDITSESTTSLTCTPSPQESDINGFYSIASLYYTNSTKQHFAYIETKKYVQFNSDYNPLDTTQTVLNQNISKNIEANVILTFEKDINDMNTTIYLIDKKEYSFTFVKNSAEPKTLRYSEFNDIDIGSYRLEYNNACGKRENLSVTVNIGVSLVLNYPDFSSIKNQCIKKLNNFSITTQNNEETTTSITGQLKSKEGKIISFTCDNLTGSEKGQKINCNASDTQSEGGYSISFVQYSTSTSGTTPIYAYFSGGENIPVYINSNYNPLVSAKEEEIIINYGTKDSFSIEFSETLSSVPSVSLYQIEPKLESTSDILLTCTSSGKNSTCNITDPTIIEPNKKFSVIVTNACGFQEKTNLTIKTAVMVLGSVNFNETEKSCTKEISPFNVSIIKNQVKAKEIKGKLKANEGTEISFSCSNIELTSESLSCSMDSGISYENKPYTLSEVTYIPLGKNDITSITSAEITDKSSFIYIHSDFNSIVSDPNNLETKTVNSDSSSQLDITFINELSSSVKINFIATSDWNLTIECTNNNDKEKKIAHCPTANLPGGTYKIQYENSCKIIQTPNIEVIVIETPKQGQIELGNPNFGTEKCYKTFPPSFSIAIDNKQDKLSSIEGELAMDITGVNAVSFTCADKETTDPQLNCNIKEGQTIQDGKYTLFKVNFIVNDGTDTQDAFLQNKTAFINYHSKFVNYLPDEQDEKNITIRDKKSKKLTIKFEGTISNMNVFLNNSISEIERTCNVNNLEEEILECECDVSEIDDGVYKIFYNDACGIRTATDLQVFISENIIFGSPEFSSPSCSNTIGNITIPILSKDKTINSDNVIVVLVNTIDKDQKVSLTCNGNEANVLCLGSESSIVNANGSYVLSEINYTDNGNNYSGTITDNETSIVYNSNYASLGTNKQLQTVNFLTTSNLSIIFEKDLQSTYDVIVNNTNNPKGILLDNCSHSSKELQCLLDRNKFNTNSNYSVYYTNACGVQENTNIQLQILFISTNDSSNVTFNVDLTKFSDPRYDHSNKLRISFLFFAILLFV